MNDKQPRIAEYFFVDIVGLSGEKLTDNQVRKIKEIIRIVDIFKENNPERITLIIPTGDGMAIDFGGDVFGPIELALFMQDQLSEYNKNIVDKNLKIDIRIGLNGGTVLEFFDNNKRSNVWGDGIINARRVMDLGDANHILMTQKMAMDLRSHAKYTESIMDLGEYPIKHGTLPVFSFYDKIHGSIKIPEKLLKTVSRFEITEIIGDDESLAFFIMDRQIDEKKKLNNLRESVFKSTFDQIYLYWETSSAERWQKLWKNEKYKLHDISTNLTRSYFLDMLSDIPNSSYFDFVNLGVGGGKKDTFILESLLQRSKGKKIRYFPLDNNYSMLSNAIQDVLPLISEDQHRNLELMAILGDFMKIHNYRSIIYNNPTPKIFGLLGSLLGNVNEKRILTSIKSFMREQQDILIIGADLIGNRSNTELEEPYKQPEVLDLMISPLIEHLSTDPDPANREFVSRLNTAKINAKIEEEGLEIPLSKKVQVSFSVGKDEYKHFFSTKYDLKSLTKYLEDTMGFSIISKYTETGKFENPENVHNAKYVKFLLRK